MRGVPSVEHGTDKRWRERPCGYCVGTGSRLADGVAIVCAVSAISPEGIELILAIGIVACGFSA